MYKMTKKETTKTSNAAPIADISTAGLFERVAVVIEQARKLVGRTADLTMSVTYFAIGQMIVEHEQGGKERAKYGESIIKELSKFLTEKYKKGFSDTTLKNARFFYLTYAQKHPFLLQNNMLQKGQPLVAELPIGAEKAIGQPLIAQSGGFDVMKRAAEFFKLSWTHYLVLMRIENEDERKFYEISAEREGWSVEFLRRQYSSSLYERLALSRNKDEAMRLVQEGLIVSKPQDILKDPLCLEFLGMQEREEYSESDLESAIISKLSEFLLELGKGFLFEARQKRFTFDSDNFFVDLVCYNRLLQCYVIIDLKTEKLKHQDLGQMQMYVNYFDRYVKTDFEKPTIGILLCKEKSNSMVELTLPENSNIHASAYSLYLPDKTILQRKLAEWVQEFEDKHSACIK